MVNKIIKGLDLEFFNFMAELLEFQSKQLNIVSNPTFPWFEGPCNKTNFQQIVCCFPQGVSFVSFKTSRTLAIEFFPSVISFPKTIPSGYPHCW